jgi:hypothetical protein
MHLTVKRPSIKGLPSFVPEEPPEPIVVDGADHWEVDCVLEERTKDRQRFGADHWEVECVLAEQTKDRQRFVLVK